MKSKSDNPTIGILLCKSKDKVIAEYSLRDIKKPIGVSEYWLTKAIPDDLKINLPTIQEIEFELNTIPGVVENGIFTKFDKIIVGMRDGSRIL